MKPNYIIILLFIIAGFVSCQQTPKSPQSFSPDAGKIRFSGRTDRLNADEVILIGSASSVEFAFTGDSVQVLLRKLNPRGEHNYVALELDGQYLGRLKLENDTLQYYSIKARSPEEETSGKNSHILKIYKATEAQNGNVAFGGLRAMELQDLPKVPARRIEFIGNSITCGMGVDYEEIPCDSGVWYDQHNAYLAYGPRVARALNAQYMISCVSGIGIYRNWNSQPSEEPVMPEVYENRYLNTRDSASWDFSSFQPDLVSIALGTNDFSDGDGKKERLHFDSAQYVASYIKFVNTIYEKYPDTQISLLTSPMVSGEKGTVFINSLKAVQQHFKEVKPEKKPIAVFNFESITPHGCGYHPDKNDQQQMAEVLIPFYKKVMNW